jgi:hypothetical protein
LHAVLLRYPVLAAPGSGVSAEPWPNRITHVETLGPGLSCCFWLRFVADQTRAVFRLQPSLDVFPGPARALLK